MKNIEKKQHEVIILEEQEYKYKNEKLQKQTKKKQATNSKSTTQNKGHPTKYKKIYIFAKFVYQINNGLLGKKA